MESVTTYQDVIKLLKNAVKFSAVERQKHIDLTLANADERYLYEEAMVLLKVLVKKGEVTDEQVKHDLGLL